MKIVKYAFIASLFTMSSAALAASWSYEGSTAPQHWGDLKAEYSLCKTGKEQSPINIVTKDVAHKHLPTIKTNFKASMGHVENEDHGIEIDLKKGGSAILNGQEYQLQQTHLHTPSENTINGQHFPLEAHIVFKNAKGQLAVISVFFKEGKQENTALADIFDNLPVHDDQEFQLKKPFSAASLLPTSLDYYTFPGSLTTPPCTEGVTWYVLKTPVELSHKQIAAYQKIFKMTARPLQPLHDRVVLSSN